MRKTILLASISTAVALPSTVGTVQAIDLELSGSAGTDVTSAYVFRGSRVNDKWNVQPYFEARSEDYDVTVGTWGNLNTTLREFDKIDYYVSWGVPLGEEIPIDMSLGYTEYTFPTTTNDADREIQIRLKPTTEVVLDPKLLVGVGLEGPFLNEGLYLELNGGHDYELNEDITLLSGAKLGAELGDNFRNNGLSYLELSVGVKCDIASVNFNFVIETDDKVLRVEEEFYVTFSIGI